MLSSVCRVVPWCMLWHFFVFTPTLFWLYPSCKLREYIRGVQQGWRSLSSVSESEQGIAGFVRWCSVIVSRKDRSSPSEAGTGHLISGRHHRLLSVIIRWTFVCVIWDLFILKRKVWISISVSCVKILLTVICIYVHGYWTFVFYLCKFAVVLYIKLAAQKFKNWVL